MADALLRYLRQSLPGEIATLAEPYIAKLEQGDYSGILRDEAAQTLFGHLDAPKTATIKIEDYPNWNDYIFDRLGVLLADRSRPEKQSVFFCVGYAALLAFIQANVTGPPLEYGPAGLLLPPEVAQSRQRLQETRASLLESLVMDGIAPYKLTPNVELLSLAEVIFTCPPIVKYIKPARWAKLRLAFLQQRILSELSSSLQGVIYEDLGFLEDAILPKDGSLGLDTNAQVEFLVERATIHTYHGFDTLAREDLEKAKGLRHFEFALTGLLGKRTKFQEKDVSQLVVLAKSNADMNGANGVGSESVGSDADHSRTAEASTSRPAEIDLNDDTLLESISFTQASTESLKVVDESSLPASLSSLDPSKQPQLNSPDSAILLALASSITSTSPQAGLTREGTLPYATRVIDGGSSNWQIYTQALLVRSRIEGYSARTVERGLLQMQNLVDQIIAETIDSTSNGGETCAADQSTTFLPRAKASESAPVTERLRYIFQLASPTRWDLEAELAARWVQLGGLRSALDIYERLEMWAEAALCWAATDREDKARKMVRRQLFHATNGSHQNSEAELDESETWSGPAREPPPSDAPRLYCILGDIDHSTEMYEKAWEVSGQRYARAQRSLGRYFFAAKDFLKAADAYSKSLKANQLNHTSWFALGCALLELSQFDRAVEAFSRCVQLDEHDAEAWSNLAAALMRREPRNEVQQDYDESMEDVNRLRVLDSEKDVQKGIQRNRQDALKALKRAASIKQDSYRIWENVLIISASLDPPDYSSVLAAQNRIVSLRGSTEGERCIDVEILDMLVQHVISFSDTFDPTRPGLQRMTVKFVDQSVVPLITGSSELWRLVSKLAIWRKKPASALEAEEKAWRAITSQPGWETESEILWNGVVEATVRLCDSYESLGPMERTEGMGAGEPVAKDWKFKARTAIKGILGRGKGSWEGTDGWETLNETLKSLKT